MGLTRNLAFVALCAGAYASNPDEQSFRHYIENEMQKDGSSWLERKVVSHITSNMFKRENYYLFSLVRLPEEKLTFVGLFGNWFRVPTQLPAAEKKSN